MIKIEAIEARASKAITNAEIIHQAEFSGGVFHGQKVETLSMPQDAFIRMIRRLVAGYTEQDLELCAEVRRLREERDRCHARLEMDQAFRLEGEEMVRFEIPIDERTFEADGIECRDATIKLLNDEVRRLRALEAIDYPSLLKMAVEALECWLQFTSPDREVINAATEADNLADCQNLSETTLNAIRKAGVK